MRQVSNWCARAAAVAAAWLLAAPGMALGDQAITPAGLQPYTARYQVSYRGLNGGEIESSFQHGTAAGLWQYETRVFPTLLARVAISSQAHELSVIQATAAGIRPLSFNFNDGSNSSEKDVRLDFDWNALTVTGTFEGRPVSLPLTPGTHDTSSVQAAGWHSSPAQTPLSQSVPVVQPLPMGQPAQVPPPVHASPQETKEGPPRGSLGSSTEEPSKERTSPLPATTGVTVEAITFNGAPSSGQVRGQPWPLHPEAVRAAR